MRERLEVHGWSRQKQANVDSTTINGGWVVGGGGEGGREGQTSQMERKQDETTHSREPRQKHLLEHLDMRG